MRDSFVGPGKTAALRDARGVFGGMPDPHGAYLLIRGLKTLAVRMRQRNHNAQAVAEALERHPAVERVFYPGLASHLAHKTAAAQLERIADLDQALTGSAV